MGWFAVHVIMRVQFKEASEEEEVPVWENVFLMEAESGSAAASSASSLAREEEGDDKGSFTWDGQPATWVFAGIRKVTICDPPASGVEITWSQFVLKSEADLRALVDGREVLLVYDEEPTPRG